MTTPPALAELSPRQLSEQLLDPALNDEQARAVIDEIHGRFGQIIGLSGDEQDIGMMAPIGTKYGQALGLSYAAKCLVDYKRTRSLLNGMIAAIRAKQSEYPGEQINIFYAGCGPYAPFVTLVAPLFEPSEVCFSLLEINPKSLAFARDLIQKMGLGEYIRALYEADAVSFEVPEADSYHILFSETLDQLLSRECYVPILCNLKPQFPEGTIIIPENVQLKMSFGRVDAAGNQTEDEPIVVFDTLEAVKVAEKMPQLPVSFPPKVVPVDRNSNIVAILLDTEIHTYQDLKIVRGESELTRLSAFSIDPNHPFQQLVFTYSLQPKIELFVGTQ